MCPGMDDGAGGGARTDPPSPAGAILAGRVPRGRRIPRGPPVRRVEWPGSPTPDRVRWPGRPEGRSFRRRTMRVRGVSAFLGLVACLGGTVLAWPTPGAEPGTPAPPRVGLPFDAERARSLQAEWARAFGLEAE